MPERVRHVNLEASFNFRDLGGYPTLDERTVRWGQVFRSDALHCLTQSDRAAISALGVRTVIDLRTTAQLDDGCYPDAEHVEFHHLPLFEEHSLPFAEPGPEDPEPPAGSVYLAIADTGGRSIAAALEVIARGEHAVVFHCQAGKDRTGMVAALLLSLLGVADHDIGIDFELSDRSIEPSFRWARANDAEWAAWIDNAPPWMHMSRAVAIHAFLDGLRERHGSVEEYVFATGLGPEAVHMLRDRLLEPPDG